MSRTWSYSEKSLLGSSVTPAAAIVAQLAARIRRAAPASSPALSLPFQWASRARRSARRRPVRG